MPNESEAESDMALKYIEKKVICSLDIISLGSGHEPVCTTKSFAFLSSFLLAVNTAYAGS